MTHNTPDADAAAAAVWGTEAQAVSDAQAMAARHARLDREEMEARSERISLAAQAAQEAEAKAADEAAEAAYQAAQARYSAAVAYRQVAAKACNLGHATAAFMHAAHAECVAADNALHALSLTRPAAARKARA